MRHYSVRLRIQCGVRAELALHTKCICVTNLANGNFARMKTMPNPLSAEEIRRVDAHWRAANYLSVGQIYLYANPLLTEPLRIDHIKPRLLGHWGTTPGLNFIYTHAQPPDPKIRSEHDLHLRAGARRAGLWWPTPG